MLRLGRWCVWAVCVAMVVMAGYGRAADPAVTPLAGHPGNVFLTTESVGVPLPQGEGTAWRLLDYEGTLVKEGQAVEETVELGTLPVGYYELSRTGGAARTAIGVLAPLQRRPAATSPIGIDVAMAWFYGEKEMPVAANLCALAGINWVRDRLNWGEMEPQRGQFAEENRYDKTARIQSAAGLRVLQVNHISPRWTGGEPKRFPPDLRDAYRFYREMAKRWQGRVLAFEPWNEADIDMFGGHTGAEIASLQKAAYLGLKAGNPDVIACLNVFALSRKATLEDVAANEAWAYFDTCNLHHYIPLEQYPSWYESFRQISAGRPLWVTEFSMPVQWSGDEKAQELSEVMLRTQAQRVPMVLAASLHEGVQAAFYFLLPHYAEGKTQFGILHRDLTPRPAYVALAAVGRLLAEASPIGKKMDANLQIYAFRAKPNGQTREVIVLWSKGKGEMVKVGDSAAEAFDHLGRPIAIVDGKIKVTHPVYVVMPVGTVDTKALTPVPQRPVWKKGKPSPIVLQAAWPYDRVSLMRSAYRISSQTKETIGLFVYNFGDQPAKGKLSVRGPAAWKMDLPASVEIAPGERQTLSLAIDCNGAARLTETIAIRGDFGELGQAVVSIRLQPEPVKVPEQAVVPIAAAAEVDRWQPEISGGSTLKLLAGPSGGVAVDALLGPGDRWVYPRLDFRPDERPTAEITELHFKLSAVAGTAHYRVILVEEDGGAYAGELIAQPTAGQTIDAMVLLNEAVFGAGWSPPDSNGRLDVNKIKAIKIGCNTMAEQVRYEMRDVRWVKGE